MGRSTVQPHFRPRDVYRSDFIQDSGTPLQWLLAWEVVGEREYAEAMARLAVFAAAATGWPLNEHRDRRGHDRR